MRTRPTTILHAAALMITPASLAAPLDFTIDTGASTAAGSLSVLAATEGTLIGDYDETTNPGGTQTRPGLFGGSGNNAIPVTIELGTGTDLDTAPAGSFTLDADTGTLSFTIDAFAADLLNGSTVASSIDVTFLYETFRTINPSSLYPGGIPLPLSFDGGELTTLTLVQTAPAAPGILADQGDGSYTFAAAVPVEVTLVGSTLGGTPIDPGPTEITLPLTGVYTPNPDGSATANIDLDLEGFSESFDTSGLPPLPEIPFELPTLSSETASVLLNLAINTLSLEGSGLISIVANADAAGCNQADLAEPFGVLDLADLQTFIAGFVASDPIADIAAPEGVWDLADVQAFIASFNAGCP